MINVSKPFLPPIEEYEDLIKGIWKRNWLTNNGPLVNDLELKLKDYLKVDHLLFLSNGTIALQMAIKALNLKGEIITTPFSYVATTSSIVWEGCKPVFADIDAETLCIDPSKIEERINDSTVAILATHVYGNPCDVNAIDLIAKKHGLKVIYDAAHAFGVTYNGRSIFEYGDISTTSFHSTKLFHTVEGGAVITKDPNILKVLSRLRNFGHTSPETFEGAGINGKNSEFHAAMGLVNLRYINDILLSRKTQAKGYDKLLGSNKSISKIKILKNAEWNYSYYPVVLSSEEMLLSAVKQLNAHMIYPRRYFFPSLSSLNYVDKYETPISDDIAKRVLCLPMYHSLEEVDIDLISRILIRSQKYPEI